MRPLASPQPIHIGLAAALGSLVAVSTPALAQQELPGTPYLAFVEEGHIYTPLANPTTAVNTPNYFTNYFADLQLPFPFKYYNETPVNQVTVSAGVVFMEGFGPTPWYFNTGYGTREPNRYIAPYWDYAEYAGPGSGILYEVIGRAPSRQFAIEWRDVTNGLSNSGNYNFQVRLYEGLSGRIDVIYGPSSPATFEYGYTMAMEDENGSNIIGFGSPSCTTNCRFNSFSSRIGQRITLVQDPGVELVALGVEPPQFATLGVPFQLPIALANAHRNALGPFDVRVIASRTRDGANPVEIGRTNIALGPFQASSTQIEVTPPLSLGENSYFIFLEVDVNDSVAEVNEANNRFRADRQVRLLPSRPDLRLDRVDLSATRVDAGGDLEVFVQLTNAGSEPVNSTELSAMLSSNPVITANDGVLGSTNVTLAAGESTTATITVTVPAGTNSGSYYIGALADRMGTIDEINESNNGLAALRTIEVIGGSVAILTAALPQAVAQETYVALLRGTGGSGTYSWEVTSGMLPQGIGLVRATGEFFGRPTATGCEDFTVALTDANDAAQTASQMLSLCVTTPTEPLTIVTRSVPPAVIGQEYSFQLIATGGMMGGTPEWTATGLPSGFQLTTMGMLVGTGDTEGASDFDVTLDNGMATATRQLTLEVQANGNLQILTTPLPNAQIGQSYSFQFESNGGIEPITWNDSLGQLRDTGLDLSPTGELSGTPIKAGVLTFTIAARDAGPPGRAARDENTFQLLVSDDSQLQITTQSLPPGNVDAGYDRSIAAIGGLPPYTWEIIQGRIPEGLQQQTQNNVTNELRIAGTPTEETTANLLVRVIDTEGRVATRAFALAIGPAIVAPVVEDSSGCTAATTGGTTAGSAVTLLLLAAFGLVLRRRRR